MEEYETAPDIAGIGYSYTDRASTDRARISRLKNFKIL